MGGEFQFFDIIILAMIAGFLVLRLRRVLGRRDGHEGNYPDPFRDHDKRQADHQTDQDGDDNVVRLPDRSADIDAPMSEPATADVNDPLSAGLTQIKVVDPSFNPAEFVEGAKVAFEMVLNAFAAGDRKSLRNLLSPDVFANFDEAITEREKAGEKLDDTLVGIRSANIVEASMDGRNALVTVKFVSEQISSLKDAEGRVLEGNPNEVIDVTDIWTFTRDTRSSDPNWTLIGTDSNN